MRIALVFSLLLMMAVSGLAADKQFTGYVSDSFCGKSNANDSAESKECAKRCVGNGADPVFVDVSSGAVYELSDKTKVNSFVGDKVVVKGSLDGKKLTVTSIQKAAS